MGQGDPLWGRMDEEPSQGKVGWGIGGGAGKVGEPLGKKVG